jgi:alpha/beta superfamily hydrolase
MKKIEFPSGELTLEGIIALPEGDGLFPLVVVCHPHPLYGGNMYNNVVHTACEKLGEKNIAWLKFNFRGVGMSGGNFAGGTGEKEDVKAAISFAESQAIIDRKRIGLSGYSFGSMVAFSVAVEDPRVGAVAGISPFVQPENLFDNYGKPKLLVCGAQDEFINVKTLEQLFQKFPEPKELVIYPGTDHFWVGEEGPMAEKVGEFFGRYLKGESK